MTNFRSRVVSLAIIFVSILCVFSLYVSVRISAGIVKNRSQIPLKISETDMKVGKTVAMPQIFGRMRAATLYYNGQRIEGACLYAGKQFLLPADCIFQKAGMSFQYFNPDNIMSADINGRKLVVDFSDGRTYLDGNVINLLAPPLIEKRHFMLPIEAFACIPGFNAKKFPEKGTAFLNYHPEYKALPVETGLEEEGSNNGHQGSAHGTNIPHITVSIEDDGVFYFTDNTGTQVCSYSQLICLIPGAGKHCGVIKESDGFAVLCIINPLAGKITETTLGLSPDPKHESYAATYEWLSESRLLIKIDSHRWIVDITDAKDGIYIFDWAV